MRFVPLGNKQHRLHASLLSHAVSTSPILSFPSFRSIERRGLPNLGGFMLIMLIISRNGNITYRTVADSVNGLV